MRHYRLHYFPESGNSYKLALMLTLCGQSFEGVWTDFFGGVTRTAEWRARHNEMGEIPVLEVDGVRMTQTAPILLQLAKTYGRFRAARSSDEDELLRWLFWDNHKLTSYMATYRFLRAFTEHPDPSVLRFMRGRVEAALAVAEHHLTTRDYVVGDGVTVADLSMCAYLAFPPEETGFDLAQTHPAISAWLGRLASLSGWAPAYALLPGTRHRNYALASDRG